MSTNLALRRLLASLLSLLAAVALAAQGPPESAPDASELPFLQGACKELNAFATLAYKNGFPRRSRDLWIELISEYDANDAVAREALGYVAVGSAWQPKPGFEYPAIDQPNLKNAKMLEQRWAGLCKKLGEGHRGLGEQLQSASKPERAQYHFRRALRFLPTDGKSQSSLGAKTVEGVTGTDLELELLRRSRLMDRAIATLANKSYDVAACELSEPRLDAAGITYKAVQSERFVVFGDWEEEVLIDLAQWAERALDFCERAFEGAEAWKARPDLTPRFAFFKDKDAWIKAVRQNASSIGDVDFVLQYASACNVGRGKGGLFLAAQKDVPVMIDYAVRKVAEEYSMLSRDAVVEGLGHAIVGMFFGRNLIMTVAPQKKEGTVAGRDTRRFELPDLEIWRELARELAFDKATAPAAKLPRIQAANFGNEERIKAWSFCDYLLRRDPMLLRWLDRAGLDAKNDFDVMAAFQDKAALNLRAVEDDWRFFYTGDSAALRAIREQSTPMEAVSKDAPGWLDEFNRLRQQHNAKAVAWSADLSVPCRQHADYLKKNKPPKGGEFTQESDKPLFSNQGRLFAQSALVHSGDKDPKKAMASWILMPGFRDALLDPTLEQVGVFADGPLCVMEVVRGRQASQRVETRIFPYPGRRDGRTFEGQVPGSAPVALLGTEVAALLEKKGRGKQKEIGLPISFHCFGIEPRDVSCTVRVDGKEVEGELVHSTQGTRRTSAPALWVFYPLAPLPKGSTVEVQWTSKSGSENVTFKPQ